MRNMMSKLKLTVNESKTRVCRLPEEEFDFLGYTFGRCYCLGPVSQAYRAVEQHTCRRLRQWLCVKHKERAGGNTRFPRKPCIRSLAWFALLRGPPAFRGRRRESFLRELDALTAPVQFDKRGCGNVAW